MWAALHKRRLTSSQIILVGFAAAILVTDSAAQAQAVDAELERQTALLPRRETVLQSLGAYGTIVIAPNLSACAEIANQIAPEHLELFVREPYTLLPAIRNAGAIFLGRWSPEPLGDYFAGPNHVLPTSGTARFFSPLSVDDFVKKSSIICCTREELEAVSDQVILLARQEGLDAHANAVAIRFGK